MDNDEEQKLLREAVEMWGTEAQLWMLIEEMAELGKAVCKMHRASSDKYEATKAFVDELADVSVMVDQWKLEVGQEEFDRARDRKMKRLKEKLYVYSEAYRTNKYLEKPRRIDLKAFF